MTDLPAFPALPVPPTDLMTPQVKRCLAGALQARKPFLGNSRVKDEFQLGLAFIWIHFCLDVGTSPRMAGGRIREQIGQNWLQAVERLDILPRLTAFRWVPDIERRAVAVWDAQLEASGGSMPQGGLPYDHPVRVWQEDEP